MTDLIDRAKKALEKGPPACNGCGEYPGELIARLIDDLARALIAAGEVAEASTYFATAFPGKNADRLLRALAAYRAAVEGKAND